MGSWLVLTGGRSLAVPCEDDVPLLDGWDNNSSSDGGDFVVGDSTAAMSCAGSSGGGGGIDVSNIGREGSIEPCFGV